MFNVKGKIMNFELYAVGYTHNLCGASFFKDLP